MKQKKIVTIQDISCIGRCSITVALPIISAAGIETSILPTTVLSTHTGGFNGYTFRDLTDDIEPIMQHWKSLNIKFDAIYTGYLGSFKQVELVLKFINDFKSNETIVIVDPAMGDCGVLYKGFEENFPKEMSKLCSVADIVIPNLTEAALMLGEPYIDSGYSMDYIEGLLRKLCDLGTSSAVLTGISFNKGKLGAVAYDSKEDKFYSYFTSKIDGYYHGTGDVFASALVAATVTGFDLGKAIEIAVNFTVNSIKRTFEVGTDCRYGVAFEQGIPEFIDSLKK